VTGDQYTYVAMSASSRVIISYLTGKRNSENTDVFIQDIRPRVIGTPEISTDGFHPYKNAIRDAFGNRIAHGTITKTYSVTHLAVKEAARRYSPAEVVAVGSGSTRRSKRRPCADFNVVCRTIPFDAAPIQQALCASRQRL
jgi:transposase-like protein